MAGAIKGLNKYLADGGSLTDLHSLPGVSYNKTLEYADEFEQSLEHFGDLASAGIATATAVNFLKGVAVKYAFKSPLTSRHMASKINQRSLAKEQNTVSDGSFDFKADIDAINAGRAKRVEGEFHVNNRIYGEHDGTLYPISGEGLYKLDRGAYKALGVFNQFGDTEKARGILNNMKMSDDAVNSALNVYKKIKPSN